MRRDCAWLLLAAMVARCWIEGPRRGRAATDVGALSGMAAAVKLDGRGMRARQVAVHITKVCDPGRGFRGYLS